MAVRSKMPTIKRRLPDCADCVYSYNPHNADYSGKPILCDCRLRQFSRFLYAHGCEMFKHK